MSACCNVTAASKRPARVRTAREVFAWGLPGALMLLVPKCPACLAAYIALWTGVGLSMSTAAYLRWGMLSLCAVSLIFLIVTRLGRVSGFFTYFKKETEPCNTK